MPIPATSHVAAGVLGIPMIPVPIVCTSCGFPLGYRDDGARPCLTSWCREGVS